MGQITGAEGNDVRQGGQALCPAHGEQGRPGECWAQERVKPARGHTSSHDVLPLYSRWFLGRLVKNRNE